MIDCVSCSNGEFTRALLTPDTLRQKVMDDFLADYSAEEARRCPGAGCLGCWAGLTDELLPELYSEQVAGCYDNEAKEMYVVRAKASAALSA
jgi:hypothetical protein